MKDLFTLALLLLVLLLRVRGDGGFVSTRGTQLMLEGSPFYANGFNAYWLMYFATEPSDRVKVTSAFDQATRHGLSMARTWAFSDGGQDRPLQVSPGSYNEQAFQGLDFVLSEAKRFGIKLVLSFVNNFSEYGGKNQYVNWARSQGQSLSSDDDFFTNPLVKGFYKNHITAILTRRNNITGVVYRDDPTIMAWELMNEPRCYSDPSGKTVQDWVTEMAAYVKSIDENHLLEVGLEGFYGPTSPDRNNLTFQVGTDFIANNQVPGIDFATVHSYPEQWLPQGSSDESQELFLNDWIATHIQDAQDILMKPLLFAEFGKSTHLSSIGQREQMYNTVYSAIFASARGGGVAVGSTFWHLLIEGMDTYRDGYEVILSESPSTARIIADQSHRLNHLRNMYVKLRNMRKSKNPMRTRKAQPMSGNDRNSTGS